MNVLKNPFFLLSVSVFLLNQYIERVAGITISYIHAYLDDVLCMPVVLTFTLFIQRKITYKNEFYTFTKYHVIAAVLYFSLIFELVIPLYNANYTADFLDVIAYAVGGLMYYTLINHKPAFAGRENEDDS